MMERMKEKLRKPSSTQKEERELSEERKKIHLVKHLPKTDEEMLDNLIA